MWRPGEFSWSTDNDFASRFGLHLPRPVCGDGWPEISIELLLAKSSSSWVSRRTTRARSERKEQHRKNIWRERKKEKKRHLFSLADQCALVLPIVFHCSRSTRVRVWLERDYAIATEPIILPPCIWPVPTSFAFYLQDKLWALFTNESTKNKEKCKRTVEYRKGSKQQNNNIGKRVQ